MLALDYPNYHVIVLNDRSTDQTGVILDEMAQRFPQLRVEHIQKLPPGWLGKNHAQWVGAQQTDAPYLLFTDADIVMDATILRRAVEMARTRNLDHLPAVPMPVMPGFLLNVTISAFGYFSMVLSKPWKTKDPKSHHSLGVGAFNFIRADAYQKIGTHQAIAMRPDDDLKLGKIVKKHGLRQEAVFSGPLIDVEWYGSLGGNGSRFDEKPLCGF